MTPELIVEKACKLLDDKKGKDIISINVADHTSVCDYFVICSGSNTSHVKALCDNLEEELKKSFELNVRSKDGYSEGRWIALDYGDVVFHIFNDETRLFYHLERLWAFGDNVNRVN
ncbi:MAG: ribosome silencing factor [Clostridia bacterium]|nr:ribosome silencing factor [Clostridia bacterium]